MDELSARDKCLIFHSFENKNHIRYGGTKTICAKSERFAVRHNLDDVDGEMKRASNGCCCCCYCTCTELNNRKYGLCLPFAMHVAPCACVDVDVLQLRKLYHLQFITPVDSRRRWRWFWRRKKIIIICLFSLLRTVFGRTCDISTHIHHNTLGAWKCN